MKPPICGQCLRPPIATTARRISQPWTRHASSSSKSPSPPPKRRRLWLQRTTVTLAAVGIGAYTHFQLQDSGPPTLNPLTFTKYTLVAKHPVSSTGSIFTLKPPQPDGNAQVYDAAWRTGVWSVMFKQPQLQIGRDYTPLPPSVGLEGVELRFYIRRDPFGEVSRYLHNLGIGSTVEMRGPKVECQIPTQTQEILFIAGGTGIAPALQAGHTLLRRTDGSHRPRIHILWANRGPEDCVGGLSDSTLKPQRSWFSLFGSSNNRPQPRASEKGDAHVGTSSQSRIVRELEALKSQYPGQMTVDYFIDEKNTFVKKQDILDFTNSTGVSSGARRNKMILVSGPDGFISYMAGPKLWAQGMEVQGPLRGIISELGLDDWTTWKL